jgi:hypothetical protein
MHFTLDRWLSGYRLAAVGLVHGSGGEAGVGLVCCAYIIIVVGCLDVPKIGAHDCL